MVSKNCTSSSNDGNGSSDATSLSPSGVVNTVGGSLIENTMPMVASPLRGAVTGNLYEVKDQYLIERMMRRVIVKTGNWQTSNPQLSFTISSSDLTSIGQGVLFSQPSIFEVKFPQAILSTSDMIERAFTNIAYFRADVRINLRVQATPFQQGALWMMQAPVNPYTSNFRVSINEHARSLTSFPGVELNLQEPSREVELVVPFTCQYQVIRPEVDGMDEIASVVCYPLVKLSGPTSSEICHYVVSANLENIKLYGLAPHSHDITYRMEQGEDEQASRSGLISGIAGNVASVSAGIGNLGIPGVSSIAKAISWPAEAVAGVAKVFGMSKTTDLSATINVCNTPAKAYTNTTGVDASVVLGSEPTNAIDPTIVTFDSKDEMAIGYMAARPFLNTRTSGDKDFSDWKTTDPVGTTLAVIVVHPFSFRQTHVLTPGLTDSEDGGYYFTGCFGYTASMCNYWRGTMVNTLKMCKTQYHSGRLLVQYLPYFAGDAYVDMAYPIESVLSQIIDISAVGPEGVEIKFPTIARNAWLKTHSQLHAINQEMDTEEIGGVIVVTVLNPLLATSTVSNSVTVYTITHWEDAELAFFGTRSTPFFGKKLDVPALVEVEEEEEESNSTERVEQVLFDSGPVGDGKSLVTTMGEVQASTRNWIKRFTHRKSEWLVNNPRAYPYYSANPLATPGSSGPLVSMFDKISLLYRFWHGSVRYKFYYDGKSNSTIQRDNFVYVNLLPDKSQLRLSDPGFYAFPSMYQNIGLNPVVECSIPYYTASEALICGTVDNSDVGSVQKKTGFPLPVVQLVPLRQEEQETAMVAAGDDFGFTYMVGPPPFSYGKTLYAA